MCILGCWGNEECRFQQGQCQEQRKTTEDEGSCFWEEECVGCSQFFEPGDPMDKERYFFFSKIDQLEKEKENRTKVMAHTMPSSG